MLFNGVEHMLPIIYRNLKASYSSIFKGKRQGKLKEFEKDFQRTKTDLFYLRKKFKVLQAGV